MIITLYKNTQTESDDGFTYADHWQLSPYEPSSMFSEGFTSETSQFILPNEFSITEKNGVKQIVKDNRLFEITTSSDGRPTLKIKNGGLYSFLLRPDEPPPVNQESVKKENIVSDSEDFDEDGSYDIW